MCFVDGNIWNYSFELPYKRDNDVIVWLIYVPIIHKLHIVPDVLLNIKHTKYSE